MIRKAINTDEADQITQLLNSFFRNAIPCSVIPYTTPIPKIYCVRCSFSEKQIELWTDFLISFTDHEIHIELKSGGFDEIKFSEIELICDEFIFFNRPIKWEDKPSVFNYFLLVSHTEEFDLIIKVQRDGRFYVYDLKKSQLDSRLQEIQEKEV